MRRLPGAVPIALPAGLALAAPAQADVPYSGFGAVFSTMTIARVDAFFAAHLKVR